MITDYPTYANIANEQYYRDIQVNHWNVTGEWVSIKPSIKKEKVIFKGTKSFWFPKILENGSNLKVGAEYTIKTKECLSSWRKITLEETGELEYNMDWFQEKES